MKQIIIAITCTILAVTFINPDIIQAQNVQSSIQTSNTLNLNGTCSATNTLNSLNVDMFEFASTSSSTTPACGWGNGLDQYFWVGGFSGGTCSSTTYSGISVGSNVIGGQIHQAIPWSQGSISTQTAHDVDVAIGMFYDNSPHGTGGYRYFVLAVYESGGEIYLDHYNIDIDWTGPSFTVDVDKTVLIVCPQNQPCYTSTVYNTNNSSQISSSSGTASYPHIDLIYDDTYPTAGGHHEAIAYVISWQQGTVGNEEVWGAEGPISVSTVNNPPPITMAFKIDDGKFPDITGVNAANNAGGGTPDPTKAYVTYLTRSGDEVHLAEWDYNTSTPPSTPPTMSLHGSIGATVGTDEYQYPRIAGPQFYDFTSPVPDDPACVVVVTESNSSSNYKVNTYNYYTSGSPSPICSLVDASDQATGDGFNSNGKQAMKPVVTGIGALVSSLYAGSGNANTEYPTVFYTDYTHDNKNGTYAASGDFIAFGTDVRQTASPVPIKSGSDYWEANQNSIDLNITSPFDMSTNQPYMAVATTNNSGHDLMFAYFDTDRMWRKYTGGTLYNFKPGKTTGVQETTASGVAVYPNPVSNQLNIVQANGANYILMDMTGRSLIAGSITGNRASVDVTSLASGIYMLQLTKDGHTEKVKFVKQ